MYTRHTEVPALYSRRGKIDANHFNHALIAIKRLGEGIRLELPGLKTLALILQSDAWIVVDRAFHDLPVVAWSDFPAKPRENLHEPIECEVRLYNAHAGLILRRTLEMMDMLLGERLTEGHDGVVVPMTRPPRDEE